MNLSLTFFVKIPNFILLATYSIRDLEKLVGVKAHTLRVWEQRYNLIEPKRTSTNIRYYEEDDLKYLINVALLKKNGYKISAIAKFSKEELRDKVAEITSVSRDLTDQLDMLTLSMMEMDTYKFSNIIDINFKQIGFERTILEIINPFLEKLGLLWLTGSIQQIQEVFITQLLTQKIWTAIDQSPLPNRNAPKFVIYLPEGEEQEMTILIINFFLRSRGINVIYLGKNVSLQDLKEAYLINNFSNVFTIFSDSFTKMNLSEYTSQFQSEFPNVKMYATGFQIAYENISTSEFIIPIDGLGELINKLDYEFET